MIHHFRQIDGKIVIRCGVSYLLFVFCGFGHANETRKTTIKNLIAKTRAAVADGADVGTQIKSAFLNLDEQQQADLNIRFATALLYMQHDIEAYSLMRWLTGKSPKRWEFQKALIFTAFTEKTSGLACKQLRKPLFLAIEENDPTATEFCLWLVPIVEALKLETSLRSELVTLTESGSYTTFKEQNAINLKRAIIQKEKLSLEIIALKKKVRDEKLRKAKEAINGFSNQKLPERKTMMQEAEQQILDFATWCTVTLPPKYRFTRNDITNTRLRNKLAFSRPDLIFAQSLVLDPRFGLRDRQRQHSWRVQEAQKYNYEKKKYEQFSRCEVTPLAVSQYWAQCESHRVQIRQHIALLDSLTKKRLQNDEDLASIIKTFQYSIASEPAFCNEVKLLASRLGSTQSFKIASLLTSQPSREIPKRRVDKQFLSLFDFRPVEQLNDLVMKLD